MGSAAHRQQQGLVGRASLGASRTARPTRERVSHRGSNAAQRGRVTGSGLAAITTTEGIALFEAAFGRSEAQLVPLPVDVKALRKRFEGDVPPLWRGLIQVAQQGGKGREGGAWGRELDALSPERRAQAVLDLFSRGGCAPLVALEC